MSAVPAMMVRRLPRVRRRCELATCKGMTFEADGAVAIDAADVVVTQDSAQLGFGEGFGSVRVFRIERRLRKAFVVLEEVRAQQRVAGLDIAGTVQAQGLGEAVLEGLVHALHASFGLRRVGADELDAEGVERPLHLRAAACFGAGVLMRKIE